MRQPIVLITGSNGEIGHALITELARQGGPAVVSLDIRCSVPEIRRLTAACIQGSILDREILAELEEKYAIQAIYHLAASLSTSAEKDPLMAHEVNVNGTLALLDLAQRQSARDGRAVTFVFPSSIAAYGLPDLAAKAAAGAVKEGEWGAPITMYGCNKLYCESLGRYFGEHYRMLAQDRQEYLVDFRALRFPGLISAFTVPTGGTSDYGPEMLHAAARGEPYACFVREDARIPFMVMPDAIKSLLALVRAPREALTRTTYNVTSFAPSAGEMAELVRDAFPDARITFQPDLLRQGIVDSWPADIEDAAARADWGWEPDYELDRAFGEYLIPNIRRRYAEQA